MMRDKKSVPKANDAKGTPCIFLSPMTTSIVRLPLLHFSECGWGSSYLFRPRLLRVVFSRSMYLRYWSLSSTVRM